MSPGHSSTFASSSAIPPVPPSRASTALSAMSYTTDSTTSSCKSHCYDAYLIPDSFELPPHCQTATDKTTPSSTDSSRKYSSWELYLLETQQYHSELQVDRCRMRDELLASMKTYYGNKKWDCVPCFGDDAVEYVADEPKYQDYTDQIVLFGEERNRFRRRYMDRRGYQVPTKEFDIVKLDKDGNPRPGLMRRVTDRLHKR